METLPRKIESSRQHFPWFEAQEIDRSIWWKGPEYLWESQENWPEAEIGEVSQNDPEVRDEVQVHSIKIETPEAGLGSQAPCASDRPVYKMITLLYLVVKVATLCCLASTLLPLPKEPANLFDYRSINHRGAAGSHPANHEVSPGSKFR